MKRGGRLVRRTAMPPGKPLRARPNAKRLRRSQIINPRATIADLRGKVYRRANGRCDLCGQPLAWNRFECHHRKKRSQGGSDEMPNLLALHANCHHDKIHGRPLWAYANGFMVRRDGDPAAEPVLRHGDRWQIPGDTQWHGSDAPSTDGGDAA